MFIIIRYSHRREQEKNNENTKLKRKKIEIHIILYIFVYQFMRNCPKYNHDNYIYTLSLYLGQPNKYASKSGTGRRDFIRSGIISVCQHPM